MSTSSRKMDRQPFPYCAAFICLRDSAESQLITKTLVNVRDDCAPRHGWLHFLQVLVALIAGLISGTVCFDCFHNFHKNQFVNGVVYGFLILLILIIIEVSLYCEFSRTWSLIVAFLGAIFFFLVAIFILEYVAGYPRYANRAIYLRLLIAGLLCLVLTALFVLNFYLLIKGEAECNYLCNC